MGESEEELKSLLMRVKEESERAGLKLNIKKTKIMVSGPITSWQKEWGKLEVVTDFVFLGSKITVVNKKFPQKRNNKGQGYIWKSALPHTEEFVSLTYT